jgi:hypothetical protein
VVGRPVFVIEYLEENETDTVGNVVALIGVSDTATDFVKLVDTVPVACLLVAKGVKLTEPDAADVPVLSPDCVLLTVPDTDIHTEPLTVGVGTNTDGEEVGNSVVDAT